MTTKQNRCKSKFDGLRCSLELGHHGKHRHIYTDKEPGSASWTDQGVERVLADIRKGKSIKQAIGDVSPEDGEQ